MPESWIEKDEKTIRDDSTALAKKHTGLTNSKSAGVLRGFLEVMAPIVSFIYRSGINVLYKNASLDRAEGFFFPSGGLYWGRRGGRGDCRRYHRASRRYSLSWTDTRGQVLRGHGLTGFDVQGKAPAVIPIAVEIAFSGGAEAGNVQLAAESYIHDLGIGGRFILRDLYTRCETLDLKTVEILAPARGVQPETAGIIVIAPIAVMNEAIRKLIERINPPGRVKNDADTAFKAHFPCLADGKMLARHGKALLAPRLPHGSGDEYRNRVASASFFLTRAGERAYVISQLEAHFGARYLLSEAFLELYIKIRDLSDADRPRVLEFLDSTLDPNILLTVAERFHFIDMMLTDEALGMAANRTDTDVWLPKGGFCYDGRLLCDQGIETLCGGSWVCDGPRLCNRFMPARGTGFDTIRVSVYPNGDTGAAARLTVPAMRGCTRRQLYRMTGGIAKKRREGEAV